MSCPTFSTCHVNKSKKSKSANSKKLPETLLEENLIGLKLLKTQSLKMLKKKSRGLYPAPELAVEVITKGYKKSLKKGLDLETKAFVKAFKGNESRALIHLFNTTQVLKKNPYKIKGNLDCNEIGIIGGGLMGSGIATVLVNKEVSVHVKDLSADSLAKTRSYVDSFFSKKIKRKLIKANEKTNKLGLLGLCREDRYLKSSDLIVEAVFEDLSLKQKVAKDIGLIASENCIYASNTSSLPIAEIAKVYPYPEMVLGMHFFSPVEKMPLVELIVTDQTCDEAIAKSFAISKKMGKEVIIVKDKVGFFTTRALGFMFNEAGWVLSEGAGIDLVDRAMEDLGFPVGPFTLMDEVGIDVGEKVAKILTDGFGERIPSAPGFDAIAKSGRKGRKNKKGFYTYNSKKKVVDESVYKLLPKGTGQKNIKAQEIQNRCLLRFVNEAALCLQEEVLRDPYSGDLGSVFGLGFPPYLGGPFHYIDILGAQKVVDQLKIMQGRYGDRFNPSQLLLDYAKAGKRFYK